jgi:hypothetical protein
MLNSQFPILIRRDPSAFSRLKLQKPSLSPKTSTIPCETAVTANHPVTRDDDADAIIAVGTSDGANRLWRPDSHGNIPVACGFSVRNSSQLFPHRLLEWCAIRVERNCELLPPPSKYSRVPRTTSSIIGFVPGINVQLRSL